MKIRYGRIVTLYEIVSGECAFLFPFCRIDLSFA